MGFQTESHGQHIMDAGLWVQLVGGSDISTSREFFARAGPLSLLFLQPSSGFGCFALESQTQSTQKPDEVLLQAACIGTQLWRSEAAWSSEVKVKVNLGVQARRYKLYLRLGANCVGAAAKH